MGRHLLAILLGAVLVLMAAAAISALYLDRVITPQFEGRRWTLPAQVFAQPLELYAGMPLSADQLEQELQRLRYERVERLQRPGTYARFERGGLSQIDIASRRVELWDEVREPQGIRVHADARHIETVADARGKEIAVIRLDPLLIGSIFPFHGEDRIVVTPEEIPPSLTAALKVVEDRKFETHHGVDPLAILRAAWINFRAGRIEQGGSTLTQQLVRSYFLDQRQTMGRKLKEAFMAVILEARFEKADLLNAYVNEIYLGQDGRRAIHGFGLASRFYFGKPLEELDLPQIALLVAVVRGPSYYDPWRHPDRARARRDLVLQLLGDFAVVSPAEAARAMKRPLGVTRRGAGYQSSAGGYFPAYLEFVRRTLKRDYREEDLTEAGLKIFTALDPRAQAQAELALTAELARLDRERANRKRSSKSKTAAAPPQLEGAVVVIAPQSGELIALLGGRNAAFDGFNRALDARRPIGSLIKPAVYLTALQSGRYHPASIVQDEPLALRLANGKQWAPENFAKTYNGPVPVVRALAESLNLATVQLGLDVGLPKIAETLQRLGVERPVPELPSMLLGAVDLTPVEVAQVYGSLASGGFRTPLRAVRAVVSADGKPLKSFPLEVTQVAEPQSVYQLNRMLMQVLQRGTARAAQARLPGLTLIGKTGTSSDFRDSWFAGFSGSHLAVVWVGYDDNSPTGLTGSAGALPVWTQLMAGMNTSSFEAALPDSLHEVPIEFTTGYGVTPECSQDVLYVPVPRDVELQMKPGCVNPLREFTDRVRGFFRSSGQ